MEMNIIKWICGICFAGLCVINLIEYFEEKDKRSLSDSMAWLCAFIWLLL